MALITSILRVLARPRPCADFRARCRRAGIAADVQLLETRILPTEFLWTGAAGNSDYFDPQNWAPNGVPNTSGDDALFDGSSASVLAGSTTVNRLRVESGATVQFEMPLSETYQSALLKVGDGVNTVSQLTVTGIAPVGTYDVVAEKAEVGILGEGHLYLSNVRAQVTGGDGLWVAGSDGIDFFNGSVSVVNASQLEIANGSIAVDQLVTGIVLVSGGSEMRSTGTLLVGEFGAGELRIENGTGSFSNVLLGDVGGSAGDLIVKDNSSVTQGDCTISHFPNRTLSR